MLRSAEIQPLFRRFVPSSKGALHPPHTVYTITLIHYLPKLSMAAPLAPCARDPAGFDPWPALPTHCLFLTFATLLPCLEHFLKEVPSTLCLLTHYTLPKIYTSLLFVALSLPKLLCSALPKETLSKVN